MTKIAIPIRPKTIEEAEALIKKIVQQEADYVELWCDLLTCESAETIVEKSPLPIIANLKDHTENGSFTGDLNERFDYLSSLNAEYIDLPKDSPQITENTILSYHNFETTPDDIEEIFKKMTEKNPSIIKIATMVNSESDAIKLMQIQFNAPVFREKRIVIGMGEKGRVIRSLAEMMQNPITFACLDEDSKTADGQMTVAELKSHWQNLKLNK